MIFLSRLHQTAKRYFSSILMGIFTLISFCQASNPQLVIKHLGNQQSIVQIDAQKRYLLLPIQEASKESKLDIIVDNDVVKTINIRLAIDKIDYFVPVDISIYKNKCVTFNFQFISDSALCWNEMNLTDNFNTKNYEAFRPIYHFTPVYGWMNDPNGMVYKDGEYHLYYQHNPYGSMWGNMHWGHAVSKDLVNWEYLPIAIAPDALGTIFSGSCVVDKNNTAGFGAGAIVAFYTSASDRQMQSMAYSLDNGRTFIKYARNPIITSTLRDFRDPKVFWYEPSKKWIMILAAGQETRIYSSLNLKEWTAESSFGSGQGAHRGVWECPDLIELPVEGTKIKKWVLICNLNQGKALGGSATQYFIGNFDGNKFTNDSPTITKWMDWGKDHYATVTWNNTPNGRKIALAWMSDLLYANDVPTKQYRSTNSIPRDLSLYTYNGETYLKSSPAPELLKLRGERMQKRPFKVDKTYKIDRLLTDNSGAYEIEMTIKNKNAEIIGFQLFNSKGEKVDVSYNLVEKKFIMDRTKSGLTSFSKEFPAITIAPLRNDKDMKLRLFVDKSSIEAFGDEGRFAMTNLIFPSEPYNQISFYAKGGSYSVVSFDVYKLGLK